MDEIEPKITFRSEDSDFNITLEFNSGKITDIVQNFVYFLQGMSFSSEMIEKFIDIYGEIPPENDEN